jgi:hypothetical protein
VTRKLNNILPHLFEKIAKNGRIYETMLNLKSQNINMRQDLKILNIYFKPCICPVHLGENWLNNKRPKVAEVAKCRQIWSHSLFKDIVMDVARGSFTV